MPRERFVRTEDIQAAVKGCEADVLDALNINWRDGRPHITCPYPDHADDNPSWRWNDKEQKAHCTCARGDSIFDVVMKVEGIDFDQSKIRVAEMIGRTDLLVNGERYQATDAASLLNPPRDNRDDRLVCAYLAHRLKVEPAKVFMPATPVVGIKTLAYFDTPADRKQKPKKVGEFPCAVFGTIGADGKRHAHRIYVEPGGAGKAKLGNLPGGRLRDPKKSAKAAEGDNTAGRAVLWGNPERATETIVCEGIETGAAIAFAFRAEIEAGELLVAAAITAGGVEAFQPWPATKRVTVAADRDEATKPDGTPGSRRGEEAARRFGIRLRDEVEVSIALPGNAGENADWLDVLNRSGINAVREGILTAEQYEPTKAEIAAERRRAKQTSAGASAQQQGTGNGGREVIQLQEERFNDILRKCTALLKDRIYIRGVLPFAIVRAAEIGGGRQVKDSDGKAVEIAGIRHRPGTLVFASADRERVAFWLDNKVLFSKWSERAGDWKPATCPDKLAKRIVGVASELGFRPCSGLSRTPLFIDGKVITARGWNAATGMIIDPPHDLPPVPDAPTRQDAKLALATLLRPFRGYLQDNPSLKPQFAAAALTAALRASLPAAPAIILDGNTIGAGKGKAARALAVIGTGELPAVTAEGHSDEETEKRILAAILQGAPALLLDNLQRSLASSTLESVLTDPTARVRKFGSLDEVVTHFRALVLITANNAILRRDMLRRSLPVRLVVPSDKPELRRFDFDPVDEAKRDRCAILAAAFTIAKAWHRKREHPDHEGIRAKTLGSFEAWAELLAGAVEWLTGVNPIDAIQDRKDRDTADVAERGLICQLAETFPDVVFTAAEAAVRVSAEAWSTVLTFKGEKPSGRVVGNWLSRRRDRRFTIELSTGETTLVTLEIAATDRKGAALWKTSRQ